MTGSEPKDGRGGILSLRHLKLFETVARLQSVRRASEEFRLSQPAVTQAIAKLEEQVGFSLFERRASGSYLNEYGIIFHRRAERLFAQIEQALTELGAPAAGRGTLATRITRSQVRSLISVVEKGSFAQAARALDVSQASLHRAARDLERNLHKPLYHRTASGVIATPAGVELARKLKLATREIELGIEELHTANGEVGGRVAVGVLMMTGSFLFPPVLNEFIAAYPKAYVRVCTGNAEMMLKDLRTGDVDFVIGLMGDPLPPDLVSEALFEAPYMVAARRGHPLTKKRNATLDDLADYDWVVGTPGAVRRISFELLFSGRRRPEARIETYSLPAIRTLLSRGDRLTLLTSYELMHEGDALELIPFEPLKPVHSIGVMQRRDWLPTQLQASFLDLIRQEMTPSRMMSNELLRAS